MKKILCLSLLILPGLLRAQQDTFYFGSTTNIPGGTLVFESADGPSQDPGYYATSNGFCFATYPGTPNDPSAGGYYTANQIFSALPATADNGGPVDGAAPLGTVIQVQLLSVDGPAGASVGFWEVGDDGNYGNNQTWSVPVPSTGNTNLICVTEAANSPTNDPYGDIQNRFLTFSQPGLYKITWQLVDTSTNGPGGTPLNQPSAPFTIYYQADVTIAGMAVDDNGVHISFGATVHNLSYILEESASLGADADWETVDDDDGNNGRLGNGFIRIINFSPSPGDSAEFFRIRTVIISGGT